MEPTAAEALAPTERDRVERWRMDELERAGFDIGLAHELARRPDVDVHAAVCLIELGCSHALAARILR